MADEKERIVADLTRSGLLENVDWPLRRAVAYLLMNESARQQPAPAQLDRLRQTIRSTIEEWARDYGQPWGKKHGQLENRFIAAMLAMDETGTITINGEPEGLEGGI